MVAKKTKETLIRQIKKAPPRPGVYLFKNQAGRVLYLGKAINLRQRLHSYLQLTKTSLKTQHFLQEAQKVNWIIVQSELEALLLEMNLIKQLKPLYNVTWRDDKRPVYLMITDEPLPKVKISRLPHGKNDFFGPFPSTRQLNQILKALRRIFPFCTCSHPKISCLYIKLGLCQPSPVIISAPQRKQYLRQVRRIKLFLSGKIKQVVKELNKEMRLASFKQQYEKAASLRDQLMAIKNLLAQKPRLENYLTTQVLQPNLREIQLKTLEKLLNKKISRIEGYDVANLGGRWAVASMVVFTHGQPDSSQYRRFKVRLPQIPNDPAMISHALARRLKHLEWPYPDLILVDGGKGQVSRAQAILPSRVCLPRRRAGNTRDTSVIGLAKREETLIIPAPSPQQNKWQILHLPPENPALNLLKAVRDEAHRFATTYHQLLRQKALTAAVKKE